MASRTVNWNFRGGEKVAGRAAVAQALYHHFGLSIHEIAAQMGISYEAVHHNLFDADLTPWETRKFKADAIHAAYLLIGKAEVDRVPQRQ